MSLNEILREAVQREASDVLLIAGLPVSYKVNGHICREGERLFPEHTRVLVEELYSLAARPIERFLETGDDDFSFALPGLSRFRVNALRQRGSLALVIRVVSFSLPDWRALGIPENVMAFANFPHGLVLFTGPAGSGKSTTLACLVDTINTTREAHVITIEDPLEYLHQHKKSVVTQRELYTDTRSYEAALRAALREAPDVILLGEMRDAETIKAAVTAAETGHLVISTLHTIGAANTVDRIVDTFPPEQQRQIRTQLALALEGVVSQQLLAAEGGTLIPAFEVMTVTPAVRNMIRESKAFQLDSVISTSGALGMITMDQSILELVRGGPGLPGHRPPPCVQPGLVGKTAEQSLTDRSQEGAPFLMKLNHQNGLIRVCVDDIAGNRVSGRVYSQRLTSPMAFLDLGGLLLQLEELLEAQNFPQAFQRIRTFSPDKLPERSDGVLPEGAMSPEEVSAASGKRATFILHVLTRQNATWQGTVDWLCGGEPDAFSSDLEFLKLVERHIAAL